MAAVTRTSAFPEDVNMSEAANVSEVSSMSVTSLQEQLTSTPVSRESRVAENKDHNEYPLLHFRQLLADDSAICLDYDESQVKRQDEVPATPQGSQEGRLTPIVESLKEVYQFKKGLDCCDSTMENQVMLKNTTFAGSSIELTKSDSAISSSDIMDSTLYDILMQGPTDVGDDDILDDNSGDESSSETSTAYSSEDEDPMMDLPLTSERYVVLSSVMNSSLTESTACLSLAEPQASQAQVASSCHSREVGIIVQAQPVTGTLTFGSASLSKAEALEPVTSSTSKPMKSQSLVWQKQGCFLSPPKMDIVALATSCTLSGSLYDQEHGNGFSEEMSTDNGEHRDLASSSYSVFYNEERYDGSQQYVQEQYGREQYTVHQTAEVDSQESKLMDLATACTSYSTVKSDDEKPSEPWPETASSSGVLVAPAEATTEVESTKVSTTGQDTLEEFETPHSETPVSMEGFTAFGPKVMYVINNNLESGTRIDNVAPTVMVEPIKVTPRKEDADLQQQVALQQQSQQQQQQSCVKVQLINKINKLETRLSKLLCYPVISAPVQQLWDIYKQRLIDIEAQQKLWPAQRPHTQNSQRMLQSFFDKELEVLLNFVEIELENIISRRSIGPVTGLAASGFPHPLQGSRPTFHQVPTKSSERENWGGRAAPDFGLVRQEVPCNCGNCPTRPVYPTHGLPPMAPLPPHTRPLSVDVHTRSYGPYTAQPLPQGHFGSSMIPLVSSSPRIQGMNVDHASVAGYHMIQGPSSTVPSTFFTPPPSPLTSPQDIAAQHPGFHGNHMAPVPHEPSVAEVSRVDQDPQASHSVDNALKWSHTSNHSPGIPWYPRVHLASGNRAESHAVPIFAVPTLPAHNQQLAFTNGAYRKPAPLLPQPQVPQKGPGSRGPRMKIKGQGQPGRPAASAQKNKAQLKSSQLNRQLNPLAIGIMDKWYRTNIHHPYPSVETVDFFVHTGNVSPDQVKKWFANKRMRSGNTKTLHELAILRRQNSKEPEKSGVVTTDATAVLHPVGL